MVRTRQFIQPPAGRSRAHFAELEQEHTPGISISRTLGTGSHTKIQGMGNTLWLPHVQNSFYDLF